MAGSENTRYFEWRAEQELRLAQEASDPRAVAAHYELANRYLELLHPRKEQPRE